MNRLTVLLCAALVMSCASEPDAVNEAATEATDAANPPPSEVREPGWEGSGEGADYALGWWDERGAPMVSMRCESTPRQFEVEMHTVEPIASEERLSFGFGDNVLTMVADVEHPSGHVVATTAYGPEVAEVLRAAPDVSASYGADSYGPISPPDGAAIAALVASCEG